MQQFIGEIQRTLLYILGWGTFLLIGSWTSGKTGMIPGLILGLSGSIVYYLLMCYRVKKSAAMAPAQAVSYMRAGWLIRLSLVVAVLIVSLKVPGIEFMAAVVGLFSLQIVLYSQALITVVKGILRKLIQERKG